MSEAERERTKEQDRVADEIVDNILSECDHKFVFMETKRTNEYAGYSTHWIRRDHFFCEKCLEKKIVKRDAYSRDAPEWY